MHAASYLLHGLLAASALAFLLAVVLELRSPRLRAEGEPLPPPPDSPTLSFRVFFAVAVTGLLDSLTSLGALLCLPAHAGPAPLLRPAWLRPVGYLISFWCQEFIFESMISSGAISVWHLPNAAGRVRFVYPLRYVTWVATNTYIFAATALALRLSPRETLAVCTCIALCTVSAFPLELQAVGSAFWAASAIASTGALLLCALVLARRVAELLPRAQLFEATALCALASAELVCYSAFAVVYFAAALCGGEGAGSCLPPQAEASWWRTVESLGKVAATVLSLLCASITARLDSEGAAEAQLLSGTGAQQQRQIKSLLLHPNFSVALAGRDAEDSLGAAVVQSISLLLCAPTATASVAYLLLDTVAGASAASGAVGVAAQLRGVTVPLVALATAAVAVATLDYSVRLKRRLLLAGACVPTGFFGEGAAVQPEDFDATAMYYHEEPHATLLFCDVVRLAPAALASAPLETMRALAQLFRRFDQLHAAAGATKVEAHGGRYVSVYGAAGPFARGAAPVTAASQALAMAKVALALVEEAGEASAAAGGGGARLEVRVGLHCGPLTMGVVGGTLPRWGVYGRNVAVVSALEARSAPGRVHCSADFAAALAFAGSEAAGAFVLHAREGEEGGGSAKGAELGGTGGAAQRTFWLERSSGASNKVASPGSGASNWVPQGGAQAVRARAGSRGAAATPRRRG